VPTLAASTSSEPRAVADTAPRPLIVVAGNPNSGKSTVFNALSESDARVANYPGVTVDRRSATATLAGGLACELVDLPGTYSLASRSREEQIAVDALLDRRTAAVLVVADATALARALYLVIEILEVGRPIVLAVNMVDEATRGGLSIDTAALSRLTGARVVPTVANRGEGMDEVRAALADAVRTPPAPVIPAVERSAALEADLAELEALLPPTPPEASIPARARAQWLLLSLDDQRPDDLGGIPPQIRAAAAGIHRRARDAGRDVDLEIITARYRLVDRMVAQAVAAGRSARRWTDRLDTILTHKVGGAVVFALVMLLIFQALFAWSEPAIGAIEWAVVETQTLVRAAMPPGPLTDLLADGVVAGVGNVVVFVPQIALLFIFIGLLEDLGYLARAAFVVDRVMRAVGLHGRAFVPMLSGFSCAVPAVLATRTLESRTDRLLTMLVLPLTSCSARLPVYVLVSATVFAPGSRVGFLSAGALALFSMYMLSVVAALVAAAVLRRTVLRGMSPTFLLELPPYRMPVFRVLFAGVWHRVRTFLTDAGSIILALTIVLWALLSYPRSDEVAASAEAERTALAASGASEGERAERLAAIDRQEAGAQLRESIAGRLGRIMEPALAPLGFDWRIGIGILGAFTAREVFVSTLGIVFDIEQADETSQPLREALRSAVWPDGSPLLTPLSGVSLMVFFVLACQCMSTVAVVRRESGTWRWPLFMVAYMSVLAYVASLTVYQVGRIVGLG
jgi:ferrous iron transport protein B